MRNLFQEQLSNIISIALAQDTLNGIETILQTLALAVDACGCILWESEPFADFKSNPPIGNLYVFAKWFENQGMPLYKVPIHNSANGYAIVNHNNLEGKVYNIKDARDPDEPTHKDNYLVKVLGVTSICIVPFCFGCSENSVNASLAVYRKGGVKPFNEQEQEFIRTVANLIPQLYEAICDKVGKKLLESINQILDEIEGNSKKSDGSRLPISEQIEGIKHPLNKICEKISWTFQCLETSIFFENRFETVKEEEFKQKNNYKIEDVFKLFATSFREWTIAKSEYFPIKSEGLTAWPLVEKKPIRIFNLSTFYQDFDKLSDEYPGIQWNDSLDFRSERFKDKLREDLHLPPRNPDILGDEDMPPLSFMAVPIVIRKKLFGVIRCCTAKKTPWFFPDRHLNILKRIAILISRFWYDFVIHLEEANETKSWEQLIEEINKQNKKVQNKLDRLDFNKKELFKEILNLTSKTFSDTDILDIRLIDNSTGELYFAGTYGGAWESGSKADRENRLNKRFINTKSAKSKKIFAFEVVETGNVKFIRDIEKEDEYFPETFPQTKQIIIAPIGVEEKNIGVLDIRRTTNNAFASNAPIMAELIGRQLGLYLLLWETEKKQSRVFEDTWHQLKGPIRHTFARATTLLNNIENIELKNEQYNIDDEIAKEIVSELYRLRGVARKAHKVLVNAGIFTELATNGVLKEVRETTIITFSDIKKMFFEIVTDTQLMLEEDRNIRFIRRFETFERVNKINVKVNSDYLEQALNCLIDNAGKYSYNDTVVRIFGGEEVFENQRYFFIAVENEGIEITHEEAEIFKRRKIRGKWAAATTGEGSGIGLWVTDHIMKAHKGKLIIIPTDHKTGLTTVKLLFPI